MLLGHLLSLTMWIAGVCLLAFFQYVVVRGEETGNSLVTCSACQSVQAQIDNWSCDINCKVANGNNGIFDIISYISYIITIHEIQQDKYFSRDLHDHPLEFQGSSQLRFLYSDELVTFGIINQLIETVKQFNETIQKQADIINNYEERFKKLEGKLNHYSNLSPKETIRKV